MKIAVLTKILPDGQDISSAPDGTLDMSRAKPVISEYDLTALEVAAQLAAATAGSAYAVSAGDASVSDSKTVKNILARGIDELFLAADNRLGDMDSHATAGALAALLEQMPAVDLILCGDGSADLYAKQVGPQLAACMDIPYISGAIAIEPGEGSAVVRRKTETAIEELEVSLPAVVSILPEAATPRICGMKDILAAGKKPVHAVADIEPAASGIQASVARAPQQAERLNKIFETADEDAIREFAAAMRAAL